MVQLPVGSDVLLTARSRWFLPENAAVVPTRSRVSTTWYQRCVSASYRHDGSVTNGPKVDGRMIAGAYP
jgi:hypothetical protein